MSGMNQLKVFTVEEANRLLPQLVQAIEDLKKTRNVILALEVEIDSLELISEKDDSGVSQSIHLKVDEYTKTVNHFYTALDDVHQMGCFLKDLDMGLVDFYSLRDGRIVYLCWKLGEPEVGFWHEVGRG